MSLDEEQLKEMQQILCDPEKSEEAKKLLATLSANEAKMLRERFGDLLETTYTLEDVEKQFQVTEERIRRIEEKALRKLGKSPPIRYETKCSFCGKSASEVKRIIVWQTGARICNECIASAKKKLDENDKSL